MSAYNAKMTKYRSWQSEYYAHLSQSINKKYRNFREDKTQVSIEDDGFATFEDFVNFLLDHRKEHQDSHWERYETWCNPCFHDYEIIMKFETFDDDIRYIKKFLYATRDL